MKAYHRDGNESSWKQLGPADINGEADGDLFGDLWLLSL